MGVNGSQWESMENLLNSKEFKGSKEIYGNLWKSMEIYGNLWKSMKIYGYLQKSMEIYGFGKSKISQEQKYKANKQNSD